MQTRVLELAWNLRFVLTLLLCMFAFICLLLLLLFPGSLNKIFENGFEFEHKDDSYILPPNGALENP